MHTAHTQIRFAFAVCCEFIFADTDFAVVPPHKKRTPMDFTRFFFLFSFWFRPCFFFTFGGAEQFTFSVFESACSLFFGSLHFFLACFGGLVKLIRHSGAAAATVAAAAKTRRNEKKKELVIVCIQSARKWKKGKLVESFFTQFGEIVSVVACSVCIVCSRWGCLCAMRSKQKTHNELNWANIER